MAHLQVIINTLPIMLPKLKFIFVVLLFSIINENCFSSDTLFAYIFKDDIFIKHTVLPKQNLYRISRYYSSSVVDIKILNQLLLDTVRVGSVLNIPLAKKNYTLFPNLKKADVSYLPVYIKAHTIKSIRPFLAATQFEKDDIERFFKRKKIEFNPNENCLIGYIEIKNISLTAPLLIAIVPENQISKMDIKKEEIKVTDTIKPISKVTTDKVDSVIKTKPTISQAQLKLLEKLYNKNESIEQFEKGPALSFAVDSLGNYQKGFYAFSNTLPIGKIAKIINPMADTFVYVKILGKIPEIAGNQRCIIKVSHDAAIVLDAKDERFLVEIYYHQ